jgi:glycosyltransferase involved in cell wall biosynthesis
MKVKYYFYETMQQKSLGLVKRRNGILIGLSSLGYQVELIEISRNNFVKRLRKELRVKFTKNTRENIIVFCEFDLRLFPIYLILNHKYSIIDICDSKEKTLNLGSANLEWAILRRLRTYLKRFLYTLVLRIVSKIFERTSYISQEDLSNDIKLLKQNSDSIVLENGVHQEILALGDLFSLEGNYITVGDWSYEPNIEMLQIVFRWAEECEDIRKKGLRIHGPNLVDLDIPLYATYFPWVENPAEIYRDAYALLAPLISGAGVKNKVLESIAVGVPVAGTDETFSGVQKSLLGTCFIVNPQDGRQIDEIIRSGIVDSRRLSAAKEMKEKTWEKTVKKAMDSWKL